MSLQDTRQQHVKPDARPTGNGSRHGPGTRGDAKYGNLASAALSILFLKFSRDDESQADNLAVRYMTRINQNPSELIQVMNVLERVSEASGGGRFRNGCQRIRALPPVLRISGAR